jgi:hypothetical protein
MQRSQLLLSLFAITYVYKGLTIPLPPPVVESTDEYVPRLYPFTLATLPDPNLELLKSNFLRKGVTLEVMGLSEARKIGSDKGRGWLDRLRDSIGLTVVGAAFGLKLKFLYEIIHRPDIHPNDIIMYMDGFDTYVNGDPKAIVERFTRDFSAPIVFGAEQYCSPDERLGQYFPVENRHLEFRYLNAGMFIGRVWAFRELLRDFSYDDDLDDQMWWHFQYAEDPNKLISLDHYNKLFFNIIHKTFDAYSLSGDGIITYQGRTPQLIHTPGAEGHHLVHVRKYFGQ